MERGEAPPQSITPATKLGELLDRHPELETVLLEIAPAFQKLKNPVLRRTVAKVATLHQAAQIAGMPAPDLVNRLRAAIGMDPLGSAEAPARAEGCAGAAPSSSNAPPDASAADVPDWVTKGSVRFKIDADAALAQGVHPLAQAMREAAALGPGELLELTVSFLPAPLIEKLEQTGCHVHTEAVPGGGFRVLAGR